MKITFPNKEQAKEAFENAMQNATVYWWDKKPDKLISVTPQCAEDEERSQAMEKILNKMAPKLMKMQGFKYEDFGIKKKRALQRMKYDFKIGLPKTYLMFKKEIKELEMTIKRFGGKFPVKKNIVKK